VRISIHPRKDEAGYASAEQPIINPDECTCCRMCEPACPANAIYDEFDVTGEYQAYIAKNREAFE